MEPHELTPAIITTLLKEADMVYFDGRLVETALLLAEEVRWIHFTGFPVNVSTELSCLLCGFSGATILITFEIKTW